MAKKITLVFLIFFSFLVAEDIPEPFMLKKVPHVTISEENREHFIDGTDILEREAKRNLRIWETKQFPWKSFSLALFVVAFFFALRFLIPQKKKGLTITEYKGRTITDLQKLSEKEMAPNHKLLKMSDMLRLYLEDVHHLQAHEHTTEEFVHELTQYPKMNQNTKDWILRFLKRADRVKFAKHTPKEEECSKAIHQISSILRS